MIKTRNFKLDFLHFSQTTLYQKEGLQFNGPILDLKDSPYDSVKIQWILPFKYRVFQAYAENEQSATFARVFIF